MRHALRTILTVVILILATLGLATIIGALTGDPYWYDAGKTPPLQHARP